MEGAGGLSAVRLLSPSDGPLVLTKSVEIDWLHENVGDNTHWELACRPAGPFSDWPQSRL